MNQVLRNPNSIYLLITRIIDILSSSIAIVLLMPFMIPVILILKVTGEKEVFYLQNRIGIGLKNIKIFKFATMLKNSENMGSGIYTSKEDARILPFGRFLRKTKINELPQLINILNGDMTIVGPRPLIKETFELYSHDDQILISSVKPGLTGIGSIVFRSEDELLAESKMPLEKFYEIHITPYKAELERWYILNRSLMTDIKIIFLTILVVLMPDRNFTGFFFQDLPKSKIFK